MEVTSGGETVATTPLVKQVSMVNVFQGKRPCGSFETESEAQTYIALQKMECRRLGIDTKDKEFLFSTKVHTVQVEESEVTA